MKLGRNLSYYWAELLLSNIGKTIWAAYLADVKNAFEKLDYIIILFGSRYERPRTKTERAKIVNLHYFCSFYSLLQLLLPTTLPDQT